MALDYGKKRVGVATGDLALRMAFPKDVIENKNRAFLLSEIIKLCDEVKPVLVLLGLPLNMDDKLLENKMLVEVKKFQVDLERLLKSKDIDLKLFDERLTSFEAEKLLSESGISSRDFRSSSDAVAAQLILQRYFDEFLV